MTVRSILEIDLKDEKFQAFTKSFERYKGLLSESQKEWAKISGAIDETHNAFKKLANSQSELEAKERSFDEAQKSIKNSILAKERSLSEAQKETERRSRAMVEDWKRLANNAKSFAGHIASATRSILSWGALTTAVGGLLGIGSLWGLDRLAQVASFGRRSALGLGLTFGEQRAFGINYNRVVDSGQFLAGVNNALHDLQSRSALYGAGLTEADLKGRDTAQVAALVISRLKPLLDQTPNSQLGQLLQARQLGALGLTVQDLERIKALSPGELQDYQRHFGSDAVRLNLNQRELIAWQRLQVQLTRSGDVIESSLIRGLTALADPLRNLSSAFSNAIAAFLKSPVVKHWLDLLGDALNRFAAYVTSPAFGKDVDDFVSGVAKLAAGVRWGLEKLGILESPEETARKELIKRGIISNPVQPGAVPIPGTKPLIGSPLYRNPDGTIVNPDTGVPYRQLPDGGFQPIMPAWPAVPPAPEAPTPAPAPAVPPVPGLPNAAPGTPSGAPQVPWWSPAPSGPGGRQPAPWNQPNGPSFWRWLNTPLWGGGNATPATFRTPLGSTSDREKEAHDYFRSKGWSEAATDGMLAEIRGESGFNPAAFNPTGGGQGAQGLEQWRGERINQFRSMFGHDPRQGTFEEQLAFTQWELTHTEAATGAALRSAKSAAEAAEIILRLYGRPSASEYPGLAQQRMGYAQQFQRQFGAQIIVVDRTGGSVVISASQLAV